MGLHYELTWEGQSLRRGGPVRRPRYDLRECIQSSGRTATVNDVNVCQLDTVRLYSCEWVGRLGAIGVRAVLFSEQYAQGGSPSGAMGRH